MASLRIQQMVRGWDQKSTGQSAGPWASIDISSGGGRHQLSGGDRLHTLTLTVGNVNAVSSELALFLRGKYVKHIV